jgi:flagellar biosynthesis protein FliR
VLQLTSGQLEAWLATYLFPFFRIGACLMIAPLFGAQFVPPRMRLFLAGAITFLVAPLVPATDVVPFSVGGIIVTIQQVVIGVAMGFALQLVFDALAMGGQLLSNSMGLSFAFNVDPLRGASTPVLGQLYMLLVSLTFFALNGHLVLIEILADGFKTLPVGTTGFDGPMMWNISLWGTHLFLGSLMVALPGMTALLVVNLAFGVMSRAAPTLNMFAIGFPITLTFGLAIIFAGLPSVQSTFIGSLEQAFELLRMMMGADAL